MKLLRISYRPLIAVILAMLMIAIPGSWAFAASITITPVTTGPVGTSITVSGTTFIASAGKTFTTTFETTSEPGGTVTPTGTLSTTFTVPAYPRGSHPVTVTTTDDGSVSTNFTITPSIALDSTSGSVGDSVGIRGSGFNANSTVTIYFEGTSVKSSVPTDSNGSFSSTFTVPQTTPGSHQVSVADSTGYAPSRDFTVVIEIEISPDTAAVGSQVTITGSGFAASSSISFYMDDVIVTSSTSRTGSSGSFTYNFTVPAAVAGDHTLEARDSSGNSATATLNVLSSISLNPPTGSSGTSIAVTGNGFLASQAVTVQYNGARVTTSPAAVTTDSKGSFRAAFVLPDAAGGSYLVEASDGTNSATASLAVVASASISPTKGSAASTITVKGTSFNSRGTVTIKYDGAEVTTATTDSTGAFSASFTAPTGPGGNHTVTITDGLNTVTSTFTIVGSASLNPASGYVGSDIVVNGTGFQASSAATIRYDATQVATATSDTNGAFSVTFKAPASKGGNHTVTITDGVNTATAAFAMDSTSPPLPSLISPEDGARLSITGDIRPTLRWANVTDLSTVTYVLEVDTNSDFSSPILEKANISGNHYTLAAVEALPRGTYYWRVKAVDAASNESDWSQPFLLKSGLMPFWALLTIIILAVVAAGVALYFLVIARRREAAPVPEAIPGRWRLMEPEEAAPRPRPLPFRYALPQPDKKAKTLSTEQQARLNVIVEFARSLPLVEVGHNVDWLADLVGTGMGIEVPEQVYEQILKGEPKVNFEPTWMHHPTYQDLAAVLEGQSLPGDLDAFVDAVNRCASEAVSLLREIYRDAAGEIPADFLGRGGWKFISGVYSDAMSWFLGKSLRDPSERDYTIKAHGGSGEDSGALWLWSEEATSFAGPLMQAADDKEALQFRALHLKLRRAYRSSDASKKVASMITQLEVLRNRLLNVLSQFGQLNV